MKLGATKEIVDRNDGVIRREFFAKGRMTERHDLNGKGHATRRRFHTNGRLARREYWLDDKRNASIEYVGADGFKYNDKRWYYSVIDGRKVFSEQWWFKKGVPLKHDSWRGVFVLENGKWVGKDKNKDWGKTPEQIGVKF